MKFIVSWHCCSNFHCINPFWKFALCLFGKAEKRGEDPGSRYGKAAAEGCRLADIAASGEEYAAIDCAHPHAAGMKTIAALWLAAMGRAAG